MAQYTIEEITKLMEQASKLGVSLELEENGCSLKIDGIWRPTPVAAAPVADTAVAVSAQAPMQETAPAPAAAPVVSGTPVKSPIVGTFYASAAPDKPPFVTPGKAVKKGDVLFIVESMKLMNEVQSDRDGVVKEILAQSGDAVEFGQPVLILE